ncbi:ABC transporter permease [Tessaracoccus antarcticus]|uniref:ABC transporter permease n=1 Tax=Tessaracoccus antarcticus TaxID=2479848 RepID=A0A3M0G8X9_9ACTN|nr:ABC transporter permease [Tessaracoccus antarcticus]RMB58872.1 ABC transporter permease [Tessaracoccus antarcticus]
MTLRTVGLRLAGLVVSLLVASLLIFLATNALPGDVAQVILGTNASPGEVEALRQRLGLDRPLSVRYVEWVTGVVRGDFGTSMITGRDVVSQIAPRLEVSLWLVGLAMVLAILISLPLGAFAAVRRRHASGFVASAIAQIGLSIPAFWAGIWLVVIFAVTLRWLPAGNYVSYWDSLGQWALHLVLPVTALAVVQASILARYVRSAIIDVLGEDWFRTARSVGWSTWGALLRHGSRNVAISLLTVIGLQLSTLLVGAIIIEQVFALPGLGSRLLLAVGQRDLVVVQGIVLLLVWAVLVINFVVDVIYQFVDPRLRRVGTNR